MAKLYQKLQNSLTSYGNRPKTILTEQIFGESVYIFRGQHKEIPAWYYVLVPLSKVADAEALKSDKSINVTDFGRVIEYLDNRGNTKQMFGLGIDPPKMFQTWIIEHYDSASIDENISLIYEKDDIRLCTMQRAIPQQKLGIFLRYHRKERFHYIEFYASNSNTDTHGISVCNESFCAVQWENSNIISTIPQSAIFKSPEFTNVNDVCFIEINGQYRKGQIIFKGSRSDCEKKIPNVLDSTTNSNLDFAYDKSISLLDVKS
ncbi:unnamed protein product [Rotaria sordida]|uniref:Uncharacterized protein n=1 Tax=Rotaria sordida TaxID=392033 RepID=A0A819A469_9BILA|nr:unnamed protein product [Rotaria sordida]